MDGNSHSSVKSLSADAKNEIERGKGMRQQTPGGGEGEGTSILAPGTGMDGTLWPSLMAKMEREREKGRGREGERERVEERDCSYLLPQPFCPPRSAMCQQSLGLYWWKSLGEENRDE